MIPSTQTLIVGEEELLMTNEVIVGETNWIQPMHPDQGHRLRGPAGAGSARQMPGDAI